MRSYGCFKVIVPHPSSFLLFFFSSPFIWVLVPSHGVMVGWLHISPSIPSQRTISMAFSFVLLARDRGVVGIDSERDCARHICIPIRMDLGAVHGMHVVVSDSMGRKSNAGSEYAWFVMNNDEFI